MIDELHDAVGELEAVLSGGDGPVRVDETGDLVISLLTAEDVPAEAISLKAELTEMLPFAPIVSLTGSPSTRCAEPDAGSTTMCWHISARRTARTSTSSAR